MVGRFSHTKGSRINLTDLWRRATKGSFLKSNHRCGLEQERSSDRKVERFGEGERSTDTHTDTHTHRHTDTHTDRHRHTDTQTHTHHKPAAASCSDGECCGAIWCHHMQNMQKYMKEDEETLNMIMKVPPQPCCCHKPPCPLPTTLCQYFNPTLQQTPHQLTNQLHLSPCPFASPSARIGCALWLQVNRRHMSSQERNKLVINPRVRPYDAHSAV